MINISKLTVLLLILPIMQLNAQENKELWKVKVPESKASSKKVLNRIEQLQSGIVVLQQEKSYIGIDPVKQSVIWNFNDLDTAFRVDGADLYLLRTSVAIDEKQVLNPFAMPKPSSIGKHITVITSSTGVKILDTKDEDLRYEYRFELPELNLLLLEVSSAKQKRAYLYAIGFQGNEIKWKKDVGESGGLISGFIGGIGVGAADRVLLDNEKKIIFVKGKKILRINPEDGDIIWTADLKDAPGKISVLDNKLYLGHPTQSTLDIVNIADGVKITPKPLKIGGILLSVANDEAGVVVATNSGMNILNIETLSFKWVKFSSTGAVSTFRKFNDGYLTVNETQANNSYLYFIDNTGKKVWSRFLDKLLVWNITPQGVSYASAKQINVMDPVTGKDMQEGQESIKLLDRTFKYNFGDSEILLYTFSTSKNNEARLYRYNTQNGDCTLLSDKILLENKERLEEKYCHGAQMIVHLESMDGGYILYTPNDFILLNQDWEIAYQKYYPYAGIIFDTEADTWYPGKKVNYAYYPFNTTFRAGNHFLSTTPKDPNIALLANGQGVVRGKNKKEAYEYEDDCPFLYVLEKVTGKEIFKLQLSDIPPVYIEDIQHDKGYLLVNDELVCYEL